MSPALAQDQVKLSYDYLSTMYKKFHGPVGRNKDCRKIWTRPKDLFGRLTGTATSSLRYAAILSLLSNAGMTPTNPILTDDKAREYPEP